MELTRFVASVCSVFLIFYNYSLNGYVWSLRELLLLFFFVRSLFLNVQFFNFFLFQILSKADKADENDVDDDDVDDDDDNDNLDDQNTVNKKEGKPVTLEMIKEWRSGLEVK